MPELPEVETVVRQLKPLLVGQRVVKTDIFDTRLSLDLPSIEGLEVEDVFRLGKQVVFSFASNSCYLAVHLRMTGRLIWEDSAKGAGGVGEYYFQQPVQERSLRAVLCCEAGTLKFYDTRRFGTLEITSDLCALTPAGLEPFSAQFTVTALKQICGTGNQAIKQWLLRQDKIVGLGNIYASEILFASRLSPFRLVTSLEATAVARLHRQVISILRKAIDNCGTTFSDFQDSTGSLGKYQHFLKVYGREGEPCRRCKETVIIREVQAGRSTFYCPKCQV